MQFRHIFGILLLGWVLQSCKTISAPVEDKVLDDGKISFSFLHLNDVYEISPLENGKTGGMARVAAIRKSLKESQPNSLAIHAGDFLSPSLTGTLRFQGKKIAGKQMVECMNAAGIDLATFGNHEFDIKEQELQERIDESQFQWVISNVLHRNELGDLHRFHKIRDGYKNYIPDTWIWEIQDQDGTRAKIGFFGVLLPTFPIPYVEYENPFLEAVKAFEHLQSQCDLVIGITHLERRQDSLLALQLPEVPLFIGGHDHDNMRFTVNQTVIAKADANAKTVYLHEFSFNKYFGSFTLNSRLISVDSTVKMDPETDLIVKKWETVMMEQVKELVENPHEVLYHAPFFLDGRESKVRHQQTNLGKMICQAMAEFAPVKVKGAIFNSGGIRIDDQLTGDITPIDIFRVLPYGGKIFVVELDGSFLKEVLEYGEASRGKGAYLQRFGLEMRGDKWYAGDEVIEDSKKYPIAVNDFLLLGLDIPILKDEPHLVFNKISPEKGSLSWDVRLSLMEQFRKMKKQNK